MQMYKVSFQTRYNDIIDIGECLVCAANNELAADMIRESLRLPISSTIFEVNRIKPSIYSLSRKEVIKNQNFHNHQTDKDPSVFMLSASCSIKAYSETSAWNRFSKSISERSFANKAVIEDGGIKDLEMNCERKELTPRSPAIEKQSIYKCPQIFAGGMARGR